MSKPPFGTPAEEVSLLSQPDSFDTRGANDERDPLTPDGRLNDTLVVSRMKGAKWRSVWARTRRLLQTRRKCYLLTLGLVVFVLFIVSLGGTYVYKTAPEDGQSPPWYPTPRGGTVQSWKGSYAKAAQLVNRMSLLEKVNVTTGTGWQMGLCVGNTGPAPSVKFPSLCLQDGPLGVRFTDNITAFPAGITVGATWNRELLYKRGRAHGLEARLKGINILLGPAMGPIGRMPAGGRNWEGFGSDPVLQGIAAAQTIKGIQDEGVIATAKHYVLNEQEHFRQSFEWGLPNALSANVDDRAFHELYLWPFAESVRAGVGSIMCSYQMVNNSYACGNSKILNGILKDELGFQGFVQSDWLAQRGGISSALAGLDVTMPGDGLHWANGASLWGSHLTTAVLNGSLPISRLNDMVIRVVAAWYQVGQDNTTLFPPPPPDGDGGPNFSSWTHEQTGLLHCGSGEGPMGVVNHFIDAQGKGKDAHRALVRDIAAEAVTLLKNDEHVLPLSRDGPGACCTSEAGNESGKYKVAIVGEDAGPGKGANYCPDRGCNQGTLASGWGSGAVDFPYLVTPYDALKTAFNPQRVELTPLLTNDIPESTSLEGQDLCLVFVNADAGEGFLSYGGVRGDRNDLFLQKSGDALVTAVAQSCGAGKGRTVVVVHSVGPVVVERWIDLAGVKALLFAHLPGQESGNSLVDVLFGDVVPSGKLPYTVGKSLTDYGKGGQVMYFANGVIPQQNFEEGLYIDYRHFDKYNIQPRFEFGFGLSYTAFAVSNIVVDVKKPKSPFPSPRPDDLDPPSLQEKVPPIEEVLFPTGFRRLKKFIYPYIDNVGVVERGNYPYPDGYGVVQPKSPAGGGEGGNPSLYDVHVVIDVTLSNTGQFVGKEVVQLYVAFPPNVPISVGEAEDNVPANNFVDFPVKVLRGFEKVDVAPGTSTHVKLSLTRKDLSYWSVGLQNWVMPTQGHFKFMVGTSSRNLPLVATW